MKQHGAAAVAVIGAGRMGSIHAGNAAAHPDLTLRCVVDQNAEAAQRLADRFGGRPQSLEGALSDPEIAAVIVTTSTDTHLDLCLAAVDAGKAVFCEKPLDLDPRRVRAHASRFAGDAPPLFLAFNRRFDRHFKALKAKVDQGAIGTLETLHLVNHDPAPPPPAFIPTSGGLFKDFTIHDFDTARWLMGAEPVQVFASASALIDPATQAFGDYDLAKVVLRFPGDRLCMISNSRRSGYGYDQRIEAFGSRGRIGVDNIAQDAVRLWTEEGEAGAPIEYAFVDRYRDAYAAEMAHFADVLAGRARSAIGYVDGIAPLELAEAALESARTGAAVSLAHDLET